MSRFILAIDQGTTGTTVCLVDKNGQIISKYNEEFEQIFPQPGWVEHRGEDIWKSVLSGVKNVTEKAQIKKGDIAAIGITNQRETSLVWERSTGQPVYNAIVWQCRRTTDQCKKLKKLGHERNIKSKTGLVLDPYFSATKLSWVLKNISGVKEKAKKGQLACGTIDTYLLWKLTNGKTHKTDVSNASRTMLMDIKKGEWDKDLSKLFQVPMNLLPEICPSSGVFGHTQGVSGLEDGIPIAGIAGDQQAALFGQTAFSEGEAKCTFGTGSFILMNTGAKALKSKAGVLTTVAWQLAGDKKLTYALEGGAFICGATVQWLRDGMGFIKSSSEVETLAKQVEDSGGVELVPAFAGLGAPYWNPDARGLICGLTRGTTRAHVARAALEAMALQNVDILTAMEKDLGKKLKSLRVDGGATENNLLMQIQANYLGKTIYRPKIIETTVAGAAYLAGLGVGFWKDKSEILKVWGVDSEFKSQMTTTQRLKRMVLWSKAVKRAML